MQEPPQLLNRLIALFTNCVEEEFSKVRQEFIADSSAFGNDVGMHAKHPCASEKGKAVGRWGHKAPPFHRGEGADTVQ